MENTAEQIVPKLQRPRKDEKIRAACDVCVTRKRRCDGDGITPCSLCRQRNAECTFSTMARRGPKPKRRLEQQAAEGETDAKRTATLSGATSSGAATSFVPTTMSFLLNTSFLNNALRAGPASPGPVIGDREHRHLALFLSVFCRTGLVHEADINSALAHLSGSSPSGSSSPGSGLRVERGIAALITASNESEIARQAALTASLWSGIALGALLAGEPNVDAVDVYVQRARDSIKTHYDYASPETLRAYIIMCVLMVHLDDLVRFYHYLGFAFNVARSLNELRKESRLKAARAASVADLSGLEVGQDVWFLLQLMQCIRIFVDKELETKAALAPPPVSTGTSPIWPFLACPMSPFLPYIEGLPDAEVADVERVLLSDGTLDTSEVQDLIFRNVVSRCLTELSQPDISPERVMALMQLATGNWTQLFQITISMDLRIFHLMAYRIREGRERAIPIATKLSLLLDRILFSLGRDFMSRAGLNQMKLLSDCVMTSLILGDEARTLSSLQLALYVTLQAPGIMRFNIFRHWFPCLGALLAAAGCDADAEALAQKYNSLNMDRGADLMPIRAPDILQNIFRCQYLRCKGTSSILKDDLSHGNLRLFNHHDTSRLPYIHIIPDPPAESGIVSPTLGSIPHHGHMHGCGYSCGGGGSSSMSPSFGLPLASHEGGGMSIAGNVESQSGGFAIPDTDLLNSLAADSPGGDSGQWYREFLHASTEYPSLPPGTLSFDSMYPLSAPSALPLASVSSI